MPVIVVEAVSADLGHQPAAVVPSVEGILAIVAELDQGVLDLDQTIHRYDLSSVPSVAEDEAAAWLLAVDDHPAVAASFVFFASDVGHLYQIQNRYLPMTTISAGRHIF